VNNQVYFINAFTKEKFKGNPAVIVYMHEEGKVEWMQSFAKELNQPITTFISLWRDNIFQLRWFTKTKEIDLCGHGTLGAAHVLWSEGIVASKDIIEFETLSGRLLAERLGEQIKMTFSKIESVQIEKPDQIDNIVGMPIKATALAKDRYIIELENEVMVHEAAPNIDLIKDLAGTGLIITSRGSRKYDFVSRYFAPKIGINEDFVTGSAHCALASYWEKLLYKKEFMAYQDSARGGEIQLIVKKDKVEVIGDCITLLRGYI
jgi:PhzF family phenazine biosynthesis protein